MKLAIWYHRGLRRWCVTKSDGMWTNYKSDYRYERCFFTWPEAWAYAYFRCYFRKEIVTINEEVRTVLVPR